MKIAVLILRSLLGIVFFAFGLIYFLHVEMKQPPMSAKAVSFSSGLMGSGYFFEFLKGTEVICGLFLLINRYTALFLAVLFPVTLNIFLYNTILSPSGMVIGIAVLAIHLFLAYAYRKYYTGMFTAKPVV